MPGGTVKDGKIEIQGDKRAEVARILEVPVDDLRDPVNVHSETQTREANGRTFDVQIPYFAVDGYKVWGATAMALAEFLALIE